MFLIAVAGFGGCVQNHPPALPVEPVAQRPARELVQLLSVDVRENLSQRAMGEIRDLRAEANVAPLSGDVETAVLDSVRMAMNDVFPFLLAPLVIAFEDSFSPEEIEVLIRFVGYPAFEKLQAELRRVGKRDAWDVSYILSADEIKQIEQFAATSAVSKFGTIGVPIIEASVKQAYDRSGEFWKQFEQRLLRHLRERGLQLSPLTRDRV